MNAVVRQHAADLSVLKNGRKKCKESTIEIYLMSEINICCYSSYIHGYFLLWFGEKFSELTDSKKKFSIHFLWCFFHFFREFLCKSPREIEKNEDDDDRITIIWKFWLFVLLWRLFLESRWLNWIFLVDGGWIQGVVIKILNFSKILVFENILTHFWAH